MEVVGRGLVARSLAARAAAAGPDLVAFASGVSDSTAADAAAFRRERELLAEALARCDREGKRLAYFSTVSVYGPGDAPHREEDLLRPGTAYAQHKAAMEGVVLAASQRNLVVRLPNIVGDRGHPRQLVPSLVAQALRGEASLQRGATRDLLDVDDFVRLFAAAAEGGAAGALNLGSGVSTPVTALFDEVQRVLGTKAAVRLLPGGTAQRLDLARLRGVVPLDFDPEYPFRVLQRRVPQLAAMPRS